MLQVGREWANPAQRVEATQTFLCLTILLETDQRICNVHVEAMGKEGASQAPQRLLRGPERVHCRLPLVTASVLQGRVDFHEWLDQLRQQLGEDVFVLLHERIEPKRK